MGHLTFKNVEYTPAGTTLFGPTDLSLDPAGITAVVGPNGSGKSLFLGLCHGMILPSRGHVLWGGKPAAKTRKSRGFIFQHPTVMRRSVAQNIRFALAGSTLTSSQKTARVDELLGMVQLSDKAHLPAALLSGGEGQAMALARALANGPEVLLMDEPTSNLDPNVNRNFEEIITQLATTGIGVIWTTHDLAQARRIATQVVIIADQKIAETGTAETVFANPSSQAAVEFFTGHF